MENRKTKIISVVAVVALLLVVITATYAYFNAQVGDPAAADIKVNANTVDTFTFATGNAISFSLDQESFASGKGNITGSTYASALLTANNKTNTATEHYYLYLNIEDNTFTYSINESTPEIIMTIKNSAGAEVTDISTLNHVIVTGANNTQVSGYDITNKNGLITLFNNREITTTSSKEEKWNITITFVNYDASQNANAGKSMSAKVMIQKEVVPQVISDVCSNGENLATCITTLSNKSTSSLTNIYYHNGTITTDDGTVIDANDNSYRYAGGDYVLTEKATTAGMKSLTSSTDTETNGITNFYCDGERQYLYDSSCDTYYFTLQYNTTNTQYKAYNEALEKAVSDGYLTKDNIKNFVCFGTNVNPCPEENLYRIIGVFDNKVKLMKYTYNTKEQLGEDGDFSETTTLADYGVETTYRGSSTTLDLYYWNNSTEKNTWSESLLNKTNLNTNFINNIGSTWANKIATTTWKVGGNTYANIRDVVPSVAYQNEVVNPAPGSTSTTGETKYNAKVGLMYASDYGFAASPSAWTTTLISYGGYDDNNVAIKDTHWMFVGMDEWLISRNASTSNDAFIVNSDGFVNYDGVHLNYGVRASFSLESSISYVSGSGTAADPILVN